MEELRKFGEADLWSFEIGLDSFFEQALAMPGFAGDRSSGATPSKLEIAWNDSE